MKLLIILFIYINCMFANTNLNLHDKLTSKEKEFLKAHPQIIVSNEKDWAPYDYNEGGVAKGYSIDFLKLISYKLGIEFKFDTDTWSNLVEKIKNKKIDIIHPIAYSKNRNAYLNYSKNIIEGDLSIVSIDNSEIKNLKDLKGKVLAVGKNWRSTRYIKENYPNIIFKEYESSKEKLEAVAFGKVDAAIEYYMTTNYIKDRYLLSNLKIVNRIDVEGLKQKLHVAVRKDWPILVSILNKAIDSISNEEILELNKKWMNIRRGSIILTPKEDEFIKQNPQILTRVASDYFPFSFIENEKEKGYVIDYTNLLAEKLNIKIKYVKNQPWSEAINDLKNSKIDILPMMKKTPKREEYSLFSNPILETYIGIAALDENIQKVSIEYLKNKKVGILEGYWFLENLKKYYPEIKTITFNTNIEALTAVKEGRIDAVISTEPVLQYLIKKSFFINVKTKPILNNKKFAKSLGHYAVRKDWPELISILNKGMNSLKEEEVLRLKQKWFGTETSYSSPLNLDFTKEELIYMKDKGELKLCIDPKWMPYESLQGGVHIGMSADYFELFRKIIPLPINLLRTNNWTQTLDFAKQKKCDLISLAIQTPKRSEYLNFSKKYMNVPLVIATQLDKPFITNFKDVLEYRIGVVKGYAYVELLKNKYPQLDLIEVANVDVGMQKIISGEIYGFIDSLAVVGFSVQKDYLGSIKIAGKIEENLEMGIAFRKDEPLLKNIFDKAVDRLNEDDHRNILNRWVSVTYDKSIDTSNLLKVTGGIVIILAFFFYRQNMLRKQNNMLLNSQKMLQDANSEFEHLINSTMEAIFVWKDNKCINANEEAIKLLGYKNKSDLIGIDFYSIVEKSSHSLIEDKKIKNELNPYEILAVRSDNKIFPVLIKNHNFNSRSGDVLVSALMDLSEIKQKEKMLTEHTKMVALGEMLGNISHQWRQPLSVISTAASGIKIQKEMNILSDDMFYETMDSIVLNTKYLSNTINDFTNFIKDNKTKKEFMLCEHLEKDLTILHSMLKTEHIQVISDIDKGIKIYNFENELSQAIINIISNSKDAFTQMNIQNKLIFIKGYEDNGKVILTIKDNAGGIADNIIEKVFEPYFTTKHAYQGTGVGLYMTNKIIVESMKGTIDVSNDSFIYEGVSYKGAMFRLTL